MTSTTASSASTTAADPLAQAEKLVYLSRHDVLGLEVSRHDILRLTREALVAHGSKRFEMPAKIGVHPYSDVFYHAMPAYVPEKRAAGCKWIECYPQNPRKFDLPQTTGLLVMNDVESGAPVAVMDSAWITAMRTPAVTILAAAALHPGATTFAMFGCGVQGREHVQFAAEALPDLKTIFVYDNREDAADRLVADLSPLYPHVTIVKGDSPEAVAKSAAVLSSATVILKEPQAVVKDEWVSAGQTILPCDLNTFWDPVTSRRADAYIVDSIDEHELFAGMGYFPEGLPTITCEIGQVLAGLAPGRTSPDQLIVNSNIGMAVVDVVVGRHIYEKALERNVGTTLPL